MGEVTVKAVLKCRNSFVLVQERDSHHWILPGGRLEVGEAPEECLRREIREELSVEARVGVITDANVHHGGKHSPKILIFYSAEVLPGQELVINNEIVVSAVYPARKTFRNPMHDNQKQVIQKLLD